MPTIPQIAHPVIIAAPASGNHITITYTDTSTETADLVIPATPFFIQGDGASTDLLDGAEGDHCNQQQQDGRISHAGSGRLQALSSRL